LKSAHRIGVSLLFVVCFLPVVAAQDSQSLGDAARQARERKQKQSLEDETAGLKEANFKVNILITESKAAIEKWVLMSDGDRPGAGRIRQLTRDTKFYLPFVVTNYTAPASEKMDLTVHVRMIAPDGKVYFDAPKFSETVAPDPRSPTVIVLNPVMDITFDSRDKSGTYTIRATVTDHVHSAYGKAEEQFQLIKEPGADSH